MSQKSRFEEKIDEKMNKSINQIPYFDIFNEGVYLLRLLPIPNKPEEPAFEKYEIHSKIYHPDYKKEQSFVCLGPGCPFCKFAEEFKKHYPRDAWRVVATPFFYWRVENKKTNAINWLKLTKTAQERLVSLIISMHKQGVSLQDTSETGRDIELTVTKTKTSSGYKTSYKFEPLMSFESKPVSEKLLEELRMWETVKPLTRLFKPYTFEEAKRIINQQEVVVPEDTKKKAMSKTDLAEQFKKKMHEDGIKESDDSDSNSN